MTAEPEHLDLSVTVGGVAFSGAGPADRVMEALERFSDLVSAYGKSGTVGPPDHSALVPVLDAQHRPVFSPAFASNGTRRSAASGGTSAWFFHRWLPGM